jgi:hypothetical protein
MPDYTNYSIDGTYWTLRKRGDWYLVARLQSGTYEEVERWGWYEKAGSAATAVGVLSYRKGLAESADEMKKAVDAKLEELTRAVPKPAAGPQEEPDPEGSFE